MRNLQVSGSTDLPTESGYESSTANGPEIARQVGIPDSSSAIQAEPQRIGVANRAS